MATKKILCVCIGNSDRSPVMAAVLGMFLKNSGHDVTCESAGVNENSAKGGCAGEFAVHAAKRIGLDISGHCKRRIDGLDIKSYDLIVTVSDEVAAKVIEAGADIKKVYNASVSQTWPYNFQDDYDATFNEILTSMYRVMIRYFS